MWSLARLVGLAVMGITLVLGGAFSGDAKKDPASEKLPKAIRHWASLNFTNEQVAKFNAIDHDYQPKAAALEKRAAPLKDAERKEIQREIDALHAAQLADFIKVLDDRQKAEFLKNPPRKDEKDKAPKKGKAG